MSNVFTRMKTAGSSLLRPILLVFFMTARLMAAEPEYDYTIITTEAAGAPTLKLEAGMQQVLGSVNGRRLDYQEPQAQAYIQKLSVDFLPYVIFSKKIIDHPKFFELARSGMIDRKNGEYIVPENMINPAGKLLLRRKVIPKHLDVFITSHCNQGKTALRQIDDFIELHPGAFTTTIHYITTFRDFGIDSQFGPEEIREDIRQLILQQDFPDSFMEYLRLYRAGVSFEAAFEQLNIDLQAIKSRQERGVELLRQDFERCSQLAINQSPTFIWENQVMLVGASAFRDFLGSTAAPKQARIGAPQASADQKMVAKAFVSSNCQYCRWFTDVYLPELKARFDQNVEFEILDIAVPENQALRMEMQKRHGVFGDSIPEVFLGEKEFVGRDEIEADFESYLIQLLENQKGLSQ